MSKPATLNRSDLAVDMMVRLLILGGMILLVGFVLLPAYAVSLGYGVFIFLINNLVFALYAFRFSGSRSTVLMLQSFSRGLFLKLIFFALTLIVLFRYNENSRVYVQSAAIFCAYFLMQAGQIFWSISLMKKL